MNLYYFGKRFYDPDIARWISADPEDEFWDAYSYVGSDPINLIDPDGQKSLSELADAAIAFFSGKGGDSGGNENIDKTTTATATTTTIAVSQSKTLAQLAQDALAALGLTASQAGIIGLSIATLSLTDYNADAANLDAKPESQISQQDIDNTVVETIEADDIVPQTTVQDKTTVEIPTTMERKGRGPAKRGKVTDTSHPRKKQSTGKSKKDKDQARRPGQPERKDWMMK